jgi:hypothetical protein
LWVPGCRCLGVGGAVDRGVAGPSPSRYG